MGIERLPWRAAATVTHTAAAAATADVAAHLGAYIDALAPAEASAPALLSGAPALAGGDAPPAPAPPGVSLLAPTPTTLPRLAFHDLVFGQELGHGTFSTVFFAQQIVRGGGGAALPPPRSRWPAYAVKVISAATLEAHSYAAAVRREMAVLRMLTHPNICRLVSAFRWGGGVYLVLEHGHGGDGHTLLQRLRRRGAGLPETAARFLAAELLAALVHLHAAGFVYADVKPENILFVADAQGGAHVKLCDLGAARPISMSARAMLTRSRRILADLRQGDRHIIGPSGSPAAAGPGSSAASVSAASTDAGSSAGTDTDADADSADDDGRVEGTEAYLSPELAAGDAQPTVASDAYAFGVTLFQLLAGRLPDNDAIARAGGGCIATPAAVSGRAVRFAAAARDPFPAGFPASARDLITRLLAAAPELRLGGGVNGLDDVLAHAWFAPLLEPAALTLGAASPAAAAARLYTLRGPNLPLREEGEAPPTDGGDAWARRQHSTIWAPLPKQYVSSADDAGAPTAADTPRTLADLVALLHAGGRLPTIPPTVAQTSGV